VRLQRARIRLTVSGVAGVVTFAAVYAFVPWQLAVLGGWTVAAALMVAWVMAAVLPLDGAQTAALATREDNSRLLADVLLVAASVASLVGVGFALLKSGSEQGLTRAATTAVAVLTVVLSWSVVQTVYMLRYASLYYSRSAGVDFNSDEQPDYRDFAYLSFTIGMTYQVSDTDLTRKAVRRTALHHALLSYLFGTVIVAMTINVVASLAR
jgi:uncharacterized membrane protein